MAPRSVAGSLCRSSSLRPRSATVPSMRSGSTSLLECDGIDRTEVLGAAVDLAADAADRCDRLEFGDRRQRLADDRRQALESRVGDDVIGRDGALERVDQRRPQRRREHGRAADQCDADHQSRCARRCAPRSTGDVLSGERAGHLEQLLDRPTDDPRDRGGDGRRQAATRRGTARARRVRRTRSDPAVPPGRRNSPTRNSSDADDGDDRAGHETPRPHGDESELRVASRRPAGSSLRDATAR